MDKGRPESQWETPMCMPKPCGFKSFCEGFWIPCVTFGRTESRIHDPSLRNYDAFNSDCKAMGIVHGCTGCGWYWVWRQRTEIRERYNIPGSTGKDLISAFCCTCVAVMQQENEVVHRSQHARVPDTAGYQSQQAMGMPDMADNSSNPQQQQQQLEHDAVLYHQQPYQQQPPPKN